MAKNVRVLKKMLIVGMVLLVAIGLLSGCTSQIKKRTNAIKNLQEYVNSGDVDLYFDTLFSEEFKPEVYENNRSDKVDLRQWTKNQIAAFQGTVLEPYLEKAQKSVTLKIKKRRHTKAYGAIFEIVDVEVKGDALGLAIGDWLQAAYELIPTAERIGEGYEYSYILRDTLNECDTIYGNVGKTAFKDFDKYYKNHENDIEKIQQISIMQTKKAMLIECVEGSDIMADLICGSSHFQIYDAKETREHHTYNIVLLSDPIDYAEIIDGSMSIELGFGVFKG